MKRKEFYWSLFHRNENNQLNDLRTDQVEAIFAAIPKAQRPQWLIWKEGFKTWKSFEEFPILLSDLLNSADLSLEVPPPIPPADVRMEDLEREIDDAIQDDFNDVTEHDSEGDLSLNFAISPQPPVAPQLPSKPAPKQPLSFSDPSVPISLPDEAVAPQILPEFADYMSGESDSSADSSSTDETLAPTVTGVKPAPATAAPNLKAISMDPLKSENRKAVRYEAQSELQIVHQDRTFKSRTLNVSMIGMQIADPLPEWLPRYFTVELLAGSAKIPLLCSKLRSTDEASLRRMRIESNDNCEILRRWLISKAAR